jgi:ParB family chromosome partitioning protein
MTKSSGKKVKKGLGTSLAKIIENNNASDDFFDFSKLEEIRENEQVDQIAIDRIVPNPYQPRKHFNQEKLDELAQSIKEQGVFTPILVSKNEDGYQLIAGERRLRAAKIAQIQTIPAVIRDFTRKQMIEIALLENIQRDDLNIMEEALAYQDLTVQLKLSQEQLSKQVHKSRSHVANVMRLLKLEPSVQQYVKEEKISMGHARALISLEASDQLALANRIVKDNLNVRELEKLVKQKTNPTKSNKKTSSISGEVEAWLFDQELALKQTYGTQVKINYSSKGNGKIVLDYYSQNDLNRVLKLLKKK